MYYTVFNSSRHMPQYKIYIYIINYMVFNSCRHTPQYKIYIYIYNVLYGVPAATHHTIRTMVFISSRHTPLYKNLYLCISYRIYISILYTIWCSNPATTCHSIR